MRILFVLALLTGQPDRAWFLHTAQMLMNAVASGDRSVWNRVLAPDCVITDEDGGVSTKTQFLAELHRLPIGFSGTIIVQNLSVREFGDAAVVHYWLDEHENVFAQHLHTRYVSTATYRRAAGSWQMVAMQSTVVARDLAPLATSTASWSRLVGVYAYSPMAKTRYRVFVRDERLYGGNNTASATELIPLTSHVFFQKGSIHTMIFIEDAAGRVTEVVMLHKYNEVAMHRL
jgi:hypothetical protein